MPEKKPERIIEKKPERIIEKKSERIIEKKQERVPEKKTERVPEIKQERVHEKKQERISEKKEEKKVQNQIITVKKVLVTDTATNQKSLVNQKLTQAVKVKNYNTNTNPISKINQGKSKLALQEKEQKTYSTNTEISKSRHNLSRITINDTGKTPKKQYVLNVRKIERIQSNSKMRISYTNNMEETGPIKTNFNHNIVVIKNVTGENFNKNPVQSGSNIARREINESSKAPKKQVQVSPRRNEIIKSEKKPYKLNYKNFNETNGSKKSEIKINLQNKMNNANEQRNSRNSRNSSSNKENKISTTNIKIKTEMNTGNKGGKFAQYQFSKIKKITTENSGINDNKNNSKIRAGSTNSRGNKNETVSIERQSSRNKIGENETSGSKVVTMKTTQVIVGKSGQGSRSNSRSNSITRSKKESSVTTTKTVTKTVIKNESIQNESQGSVVRKFRSIRMIKKDNK